MGLLTTRVEGSIVERSRDEWLRRRGELAALALMMMSLMAPWAAAQQGTVYSNAEHEAAANAARDCVNGLAAWPKQDKNDPLSPDVPIVFQTDLPEMGHWDPAQRVISLNGKAIAAEFASILDGLDATKKAKVLKLLFLQVLFHECGHAWNQDNGVDDSDPTGPFESGCLGCTHLMMVRQDAQDLCDRALQMKLETPPDCDSWKAMCAAYEIAARDFDNREPCWSISGANCPGSGPSAFPTLPPTCPFCDECP